MDTSLAGRIALVTGGGRGLGAAVSRRLASAGARVAVVGRDKDVLEALASELPNDPVVLAADLAEPDGSFEVLAEVVRRTGRIDVLVNNAGRASQAPIDDLPARDADEVWALNLRAPVQLAGRAARLMAADGGGSIVNVSSALSASGSPSTALYAATKGGLDAFTRSLATEFGPSGVRVNAVRPGVTRSDMSAGILSDDDARARYEAQVPLRRAGEAEELAEVVAFLASPAASYVTGQVIDVDGGWATSKPSIF